jgi:DNA-binding FadR family transcriptional regulator
MSPFLSLSCTSGLCFPSYESIAESAGCARSTVAEAINMLERAGVLTWSHRVRRLRVSEPDLFWPCLLALAWHVQRLSLRRSQATGEA